MDSGSKVVESTDGQYRVWDAVKGQWLGPYTKPEATAKARTLRARPAERKIAAEAARAAQGAMFDLRAPVAPVHGEYSIHESRDGWRVWSPRLSRFVVSDRGEPFATQLEARAAMLALQRSEAAGPKDASAQLGLFVRKNGRRVPIARKRPVRSR